jgi:hypothetical protein
MLDLNIAAAHYVLELLPSWELPNIATDALASGLDSPAVRQLGGLRETTMADAGPLFERMLADLNVGLPSSEQAVQRLLRHHIQELAQRRVSAREGLKKIVELSYLGERYEQSRMYAGEAYGIEHLIGARWAYDDLDTRPTEVSFQGLYGREAALALDEDVVRLAMDWLKQHGA